MTKWLLLFTLCIGMSLQAHSQSIEISDLDAIVYGEPSASVLTAHATVKNISSSPINITVDGGHESGAPANANYYFCWFVCYSAIPVADHFQIPTNHVVTLQPGQDTTGLFAAYYEPQGEIAIAEFEYCFTNADNAQDQTCVTITFDTQNVGIEDVFTSDNSGISEAYPNPAISNVRMNYSLEQGWNDATIDVYSMLGSKVRTLGINEKSGTVNVDVSSLPAGMYFYTLNVDGDAISTKKMLVTK